MIEFVFCFLVDFFRHTVLWSPPGTLLKSLKMVWNAILDHGFILCLNYSSVLPLYFVKGGRGKEQHFEMTLNAFLNHGFILCQMTPPDP